MTELALVLLKIFEGFRPQVYEDVVGYGTIGYGHKVLPGENWNGGITPIAAEQLLVRDFESHKNEVAGWLSGVKVEEWELEAMGSLCFNVGPVRFRGSTLLMMFRTGERRKAAWEFLKWKNAGGHPIAGLVKRRHVESVWFLGAAPETLLDYVRTK